MKEKFKKLLETQDVRATSHPQYRVMSRDGAGNVKFIDQFLTQEFADRHIRQIEGRVENSGLEFYVFVDSGCRNDEWQAIRKILMEG